MLTLLLLLVLPSADGLHSPDYWTRYHTHAAYDTPLGALRLYLLRPDPLHPEAAWRSRWIVGTHRQRLADTGDVYAWALIESDPRWILAAPRDFCRMIDTGGFFWCRDSYKWAEMPRPGPDWKIADDLVFVAKESLRKRRELLCPPPSTPPPAAANDLP